VVSHDLKAPLRAIHTYADFLGEDLQGCLDDEQQSYLNGLKKALREADTLIEDILTLSRLERHHAEVETFQVGECLRTVIDTLNIQDNVEIVMVEEWPTIIVESVLFRQIFQNLIGNAVKFTTSPHKRIELGWQSVGKNRYEIFVRDNGIGIEPSYQQKIFQIFERLYTKDEFDGTGIGLAIVKKAVSKLGGAIRLESTPGQGSTFFITLPAKPGGER
jgi:signal transduction histidine kinase